MGTGVHVRIGSSPVSPAKKIQKYITNTCFSRIYYVNLHISSLINRLMAAWCNGSHAGLKYENLSAPGETLDVEPS